MVLRGRSIALAVAFLIGCAVLLMSGASGSQAEASQQNKQEHTEACKKAQGSSPQATASDEARCGGTRTYRRKAEDRLVYTTNDLPGCPKGGLLLGTDKADEFPRPGLDGQDGDDRIHGLGGSDDIFHGSGDDAIYAGPGNDDVFPDEGKDVIYGGDGNDMLGSIDVDGGTISIAVLAGTATLLEITTMWTAVARRRPLAPSPPTTLGTTLHRYEHLRLWLRPAPCRFRRVVVLPSFCRLPRCCSGRAS